MKLKSNNKRISEVELTEDLHHLSYLIDNDDVVEIDATTFNFILDNITREYIGIKETAIVRDPEDEDIITEEIPFEAYFIK